jgi:hypothetical protein
MYFLQLTTLYTRNTSNELLEKKEDQLMTDLLTLKNDENTFPCLSLETSFKDTSRKPVRCTENLQYKL